MKKALYLMGWSVLAIGMAGLCAAGMAGCGGDEPEPAPPTEQPAPAPDSAAKAVPEPAATPAPTAESVKASPSLQQSHRRQPAGAVTPPETVQVLKYLPEAAQVAVGIPAINGYVDKLLALDKKFATLNFELALNTFVQEVTDEFNVPEAETLNDIASAKGLDFDAPCALFLNLKPLFAAAVQQQQAMMSKMAEKEEAETTSENGSKPLNEVDSDVKIPAEAKPTPAMPQVPDIDSLEMAPEVVMVLRVDDRVKAEQALADLIELLPDLYNAGRTEEEIDAAVLVAYGEYGYLFDDNHLLLGSKTLVKEAFMQSRQPTPLRYGTPACPGTPDELVSLLFMKRLMPMILEMQENTPVPEPAAALAEAQNKMLKEMFDSNSQDDPMVTALVWDDNRLEIRSEMDMAMYPGILAFSGQPDALQLAPLLPESTCAFLSMQFLDVFKKQVLEVYLPAASQLAGEDSPEKMQSIALANQIITMLGEEITLGVVDSAQEMPAIILMIAMADVEAATSMMEMFLPATPVEESNGIPIKALALPTPIPVHFAVPDDFLLASTDIDMLRSILGLYQKGGLSNLFEMLEPPMDPEIPRYNALVIKKELIKVIEGAAKSFGEQAPFEPDVTTKELLRLVREFRMVGELDGSWSVSRVSLFLN